MNKYLIVLLTIAFIGLCLACPAVDLNASECDIVKNGVYYIESNE